MIDSTDVADVIRTIILLVGFALAGVTVKFAYLAIRNGEGFRAWGLASYGLIVITPAVIGLSNYEKPLNGLAAVTYFSGLVCGFMALRQVLTITPEWTRIRRADHERRHAAARDERRDGEDRLRVEDRAAQDTERAESRSLHHPDPDADAAQDDARTRSRHLQDEDRDDVRRRNADDDRA